MLQSCKSQTITCISIKIISRVLGLIVRARSLSTNCPKTRMCMWMTKTDYAVYIREGRKTNTHNYYYYLCIYVPRVL